MERTILIDGGALRTHRRSAGLTQEELAERVRAAKGRCTVGFISKLERGELKGLSPANYERIVTILRITDDTLRDPCSAVSA